MVVNRVKSIISSFQMILIVCLNRPRKVRLAFTKQEQKIKDKYKRKWYIYINHIFIREKSDTE